MRNSSRIVCTRTRYRECKDWLFAYPYRIDLATRGLDINDRESQAKIALAEAQLQNDRDQAVRTHQLNVDQFNAQYENQTRVNDRADRMTSAQIASGRRGDDREDSRTNAQIATSRRDADRNDALTQSQIDIAGRTADRDDLNSEEERLNQQYQRNNPALSPGMIALAGTNAPANARLMNTIDRINSGQQGSGNGSSGAFNSAVGNLGAQYGFGGVPQQTESQRVNDVLRAHRNDPMNFLSKPGPFSLFGSVSSPEFSRSGMEQEVRNAIQNNNPDRLQELIDKGLVTQEEFNRIAQESVHEGVPGWDTRVDFMRKFGYMPTMTPLASNRR